MSKTITDTMLSQNLSPDDVNMLFDIIHRIRLYPRFADLKLIKTWGQQHLNSPLYLLIAAVQKQIIGGNKEGINNQALHLRSGIKYRLNEIKRSLKSLRDVKLSPLCPSGISPGGRDIRIVRVGKKLDF